MPSKDWDKELAKIDKQLESISDDALMPTKAAPTPAAKTAVKEKQRTTTTLGVMLRLVLAIALGVGILFWPYDARCGAGLAGYLGAVAAIVGGGVWTSIWTWRHRTAKAHVLSLLIVLWGGLLAAQEILPRVGYAHDVARVAWVCP
jgi:hypothetical protein